MTSTVRRITPVLIVDAIEPCLPFWIDRLGFAATAEVPHEGRLGFVILARDGVEVMYQTKESVEADTPGMTRGASGASAALYVEVADVDAVERALAGTEIAVPRRHAFYGMDEIGVREPGGHVVMFAQPVPPGSA